MPIRALEILPVAVGVYHLVAWLSDLRRRGSEKRDVRVASPVLSRFPKVSVLVAAWNERRLIERHITSVLAIRYPRVEYVLCAGGDDGTFDAAQATLNGRGILLRQVSGEGKQRALRRCLSHATAEVVYLTDADCILTDDSFERVIVAVVAGARAATGRSRPLPEQQGDPSVLCQWAPQYVAESRQDDHSRGLLGRNCAVDREALHRAGDFAAEVATGTDYHLARALIRSGTAITFVRDSFVQAEFPRSPTEYVSQQSRWLRSHWLHARRTGETELQLHAVRSWLAGLAVLGLPLAWPLAGSSALWLWLGLVIHGVASRLRYVDFLFHAERLPGELAALGASPYCFLIDAFAWVLSLADLLVPQRRYRW